MTTEAQQIQRSIEDSIRENRAVVIEAVIDTAEWVNFAEALGAECDDYAEESVECGAQRTYWGTDDDSDKWQIRLVGEKM